jgi:predicted DNA-binding transcriptional regulator AlpA
MRRQSSARTRQDTPHPAPGAGPLLTATPWLLVGCGRSSWYRALARGEVPQPVQTPGGRRWRVADVLAWVAALKPARRRARNTDVAE